MPTNEDLLEMNLQVRADAERITNWLLGRVLHSGDKAYRGRNAGNWWNGAEDLYRHQRLLDCIETLARDRALPLPPWKSREYIRVTLEWLDKVRRGDTVIPFPLSR
jgi:hypothetical protein